jgi:hypothetical protein
VSDPVDALLRDLLAWLAGGERSYAEVMDAWRTSCPRLPVWEEANARRFVSRESGAIVRVTPSGREFLQQPPQ